MWARPFVAKIKHLFIVRIFRYLPPSPNETRAFYVLAFGSFVGQFVAFAFALGAPNAMAGAVAVGGGLAILARFASATWQFDSRRRRARARAASNWKP